jgi:hypothetical protein
LQERAERAERGDAAGDVYDYDYRDVGGRESEFEFDVDGDLERVSAAWRGSGNAGDAGPKSRSLVGQKAASVD